MTKSQAPRPTALTKIASRRQILGGLSALAVTTACSSGTEEPNATGGYGGGGAGAGGTGTGGAGAGGMGAGAGGAGAGGTGAGTGGAGTGGTTGGAGGTAGGAGGTTGGTAGSAGAGGSGGGGGLVPAPPPWDDAPMCTASKTDPAGQGPFFIHELEKNDDIMMKRQDISGQYDPDAPEGVEMHLHLRLLDSTASTTCNEVPLADVDVYIWHTDGQGYYSGFGLAGTPTEQFPDEPYAGAPGQNDLQNTDRFCRGIQTTDANGVVSFKSVFPGWYNGRDLHIHFVAFKKDSTSLGRATYGDQNSGGKWLFTTQFYFEEAFSKSVHEEYEPYKARTALSAYQGAMNLDMPTNSGLRAKASLDTSSGKPIVTAQMQILLDPKA
jgi:protocatechuate 3,4-dioxygenase beta subunit